MSNKQQNKIYFISGVSGVGKTSTLKHLKNSLPADTYDVRDLDERGVPDGGGLMWLNNETRYWLDVAKQNAIIGKSTIICGFSNPELFKSVYRPDEDIPAQLILLHASGDTLKKRLQGRHNTPKSIEEIERAAGIPLEKFIENNIAFSPEFKKIFQKNDYAVIETDSLTPEEVTTKIVELLN